MVFYFGGAKASFHGFNLDSHSTLRVSLSTVSVIYYLDKPKRGGYEE